MFKLRLLDNTPPRTKKLKITPDIRARIGVFCVYLAIPIALVFTYATSATIRRPVDRYLGRMLNHPLLYEQKRAEIDHDLIGTPYSVMHVPTAGIAVIFDVSQTGAEELSDTTTEFTPLKPFVIDPANSTYSEEDLGDCYRVTVPKRCIAAIVVDMDVTTHDTLNAMLAGLDCREIGPIVTTGTYAAYVNDRHVVNRLYHAGVIDGAIQTSRWQEAVNPQTGDALVAIPIDRKQVMDVMLGRDMRRSASGIPQPYRSPTTSGC